ncbi:MAG: hypothetical protein R2747_15665 [Pyrinomonadaceae bacterium]
MAKGVIIHNNNFEKLLQWLDQDPNLAGQKYELIRQRLIKIFLARGSRTAEELADQTIERVTGKMDFLAENYEGDPALYFYGVAKNVFRESLQKPDSVELPTNLAQNHSDSEELEIKDRCLGKCLKELSPEQREFILKYYEKDRQEKIDQRRHLSEELEISSEALRVRAFRIRLRLQECLLKCLKENS